jgi:hypothetical protein
MRFHVVTRFAWVCASPLALACSSTASPGGVPSDGGSMGDGSDSAPADDGPNGDGAPSDGGADAMPVGDGGLPFSCTPPPHPNPCPAPSGKDGEASFCYRPGWAGVTSVDVYVGKTGQASDWTTPFATLTKDASGTFTGAAALADGTYPYVFRVHGSADGLVRDGTYLRDPENPSFQPTVTGAPPRSLSVITVPQAAAQTHQVRGVLSYAGSPQSCYSVDLEVGELHADGGSMVLSEHGTAAYTETETDGSYAFTVADGPIGVIIRYPFGLSSTYPDPTTTPSLGITRTNAEVMGSDLTLPSVDVAYPLADYAAMSPTPNSMATLPVTFKLTVIPGSTLAQISVTSTNIAGNDPAYASGFTANTSVMWNGTFGGMGGNAKPGTTYYWGTWQEASAKGGWVGESLLFPIQFK